MNRSVHHPFALLLDKAQQQPEVAEGLAAAYSELNPTDRINLIRAIVNDALAGEIVCWPLLARFLALETDPAVAQTLLIALKDQPSCEQLFDDDRVWLCGDKKSGAAVVAFRLAEPFVEWFALSWRNKQVNWTYQKALGVANEFEHIITQLCAAAIEQKPSAVGLQWGLDQVCDVLWAHKRETGTMPEGLEGLAERLIC
ncbi:MAG: hypothetical protein IPJ88_12390 [Myxococcales bacterium]|nr:MAG: hypothetical protein IPJ88_12390 [Myxococcales bacterium]